MYALYQHYGFGRGDIGHLLVAGFSSLMVFGTVVDSLADSMCAPSRAARRHASLGMKHVGRLRGVRITLPAKRAAFKLEDLHTLAMNTLPELR